jgi:DNA primase
MAIAAVHFRRLISVCFIILIHSFWGWQMALLMKQPGDSGAKRIPDSVVDDVKARADAMLVEIIGEAVDLRKAGNSFVGLCPFHKEASPSFSVSPGKGFYHCYGCGANGRALDFMQERHGMDFLQAIKYLAARVGIRLPNGRESSDRAAPVQPLPGPTIQRAIPEERPQVAPQRKAALSAVLSSALAYFRSSSAPNATENQTLMAWSASRGVTLETLERFEIAIAPAGWHALKALFGDRYDVDPDILAVDLVRERESERGRAASRFDTFRERVLFPVRDTDGALVGFGGRRLRDMEPKNGNPKYLNTATTEIFHKGHLLYGLNLAQDDIRRAGFALVVEGYMDVVMMAQSGFGNTVASMGTAFRSTHLKVLRDYTDNVVYLFDGDAAGKRAMWRAMKESLPSADRMNFRFVALEDTDPDEWVRAVGAEAVQDAIDRAPTLAPYFVECLREMAQEAAQQADAPAARSALQRETKALLALVPASSRLREYLEREAAHVLNPQACELSRADASMSSLEALQPGERLLTAAYLRPTLAMKVRAALPALLPNNSAKARALLVRFDRAIERGIADRSAVRTDADLLWARVTLTSTPELVAEHFSAESATEHVAQSVHHERPAPGA